MIFTITGFQPDVDGVVFTQEVDLVMADLTPVMSWKDESDFVGAVFPLSIEQARLIENLAKIKLPIELSLFIHSFE